MVVTNTGKNWLRDQLEAGISSVKLGTGQTDPTVSDTSLETLDATTSAVPINTTGNKIVNSTHILPSTIGVGTSYYEAGLFVSSDTIMYDRIVFPEYAHTANDELHDTFVERFE